MLAVTAGYLCVEIPFSIHLIQTVAAGNEADISTFEKFGRVLTGLAVFIAILGMSLLPFFRDEGTPTGEAAGTVAAGFLIALAGCYFGLYGYGQYRAWSASDEDLRRSYIGLMAQREIAASGLAGIRPEQENPAWRAFLATISASLDMPRVIESKGTVPELAEREAFRQIGAADQFRKRYFDRIEADVSRSYRQYAEGSNAYVKARQNIERDGAAEWNAYLSELRSRYPEGVPVRGWTAASIRNKVMERLPVSSNWPILDRSGFMAAYRKTAAKQIEEDYRSQSVGLAPGMSAAQFWKSSKVQDRIREQTAQAFGIEIATVITPAMSDKAFQAAIYRPVLTRTKNEVLAMAVGKQSLSSGDRGRLENAYLIATLPASALLFSLAGAALHIFKAAGYAAAVIGLGRFRFPIAGLVLFGGIAAMIVTGDTITTAGTFLEFEASGIMPTVIKYAVSIQPAFERIAAGFESVGVWSGINNIIDLVAH